MAEQSAMVWPWILADRAASLSRAPPQEEQVACVMARSANARAADCIDSLSLPR